MGLKRWMSTSLAAGVVALSVAGCGEDDPGTKPAEFTDPPATSASQSPEGSSSAAPDVDPEEQAVIDAYKGYFTTLLAIGSADLETATAMLEPYAEGAVLERLATFVPGLKEAGVEPAGHVVFGELDITVSGESATVSECRDASTELIVDSASKAEVSAGGPGTAITADVFKGGDGWRLSDYEAVEGGC